jgi:hypothetical protein
MGIRDSLLALAPPWLSDPTKAGGKFIYTIGLMDDAVLDKTEQALFARLPGLADPSALPLIGSDRLIPSGPSESESQYRRRLRGAFDLWQRAGINMGVLRQVLGYLEAFAPRARIVTDSSRWTTVAPGVDLKLPASYQDGSGNWDWDSAAYPDPHPMAMNAWWRWWLILYSTASSGGSWAGSSGVWGDGHKWGDKTRSWGLGVPSTTIRSIRGIIGLAKRAGSWCRWLIISFDDSLFDQTAPGDDVINPAGGWSRWGKYDMSGNYVPARPANARYCDGWASTGSTAASDAPTY